MTKIITLIMLGLLMLNVQCTFAKQKDTIAQPSNTVSSYDVEEENFDFDLNSYNISDEQVQDAQDIDKIDDNADFDDKVINSSHFSSGTVKAIIEALDAKDSFTLGRSRRVAFYAMKITNKLALPPEEVSKIELAGLLHDIGMIGVAEEILNKTQKLTDDEYQKIKMHVQYSVKILEDIKQLYEITEIIKYHHEYYNGCGYPYGIKGDEIPLGSKIIAIADAYDALVSNRAYRNGMNSEEAMKRIEEGSGKQFDPHLVQIFKSVLPEIEQEITDFEKTQKTGAFG